MSEAGCTECGLPDDYCACALALDDGRPGFSERFANEEPIPCAKCWKQGFFHWPSLAGHKPIPLPAPALDDAEGKG